MRSSDSGRLPIDGAFARTWHDLARRQYCHSFLSHSDIRCANQNPCHFIPLFYMGFRPRPMARSMLLLLGCTLLFGILPLAF